MISLLSCLLGMSDERDVVRLDSFIGAKLRIFSQPLLSDDGIFG
jgi:hypothetical protein